MFSFSVMKSTFCLGYIEFIAIPKCMLTSIRNVKFIKMRLLTMFYHRCLCFIVIYLFIYYKKTHLSQDSYHHTHAEEQGEPLRS